MDRVTEFFQGRLSGTSRVLLLVVAIAMLPSIALPTWTVRLHAPQYPDGLELEIRPNTVEGDLQEVNLLNHYIGMKEIEPNEFPEFRFIPFFILRFFGFALLAALVARMPVAAIGYLDFVIFGIVMLYTFRHWLTDYGTNLSPDAPVHMDPFVPNLIGGTEIGNFEVVSQPAVGAVLMILAGLAGPVILGYEWRRRVREEG